MSARTGIPQDGALYRGVQWLSSCTLQARYGYPAALWCAFYSVRMTGAERELRAEKKEAPLGGASPRWDCMPTAWHCSAWHCSPTL